MQQDHQKDFYEALSKTKELDSYAISRCADGEAAVLKNETIGNKDTLTLTTPASADAGEADGTPYDGASDFSVPAEPSDPLGRMVKYALGIFVALIILLLAASYQNSEKYYVLQKENEIEIWRGQFAPMGRQIFITLPSIKISEPIHDEYRRQEIYPIIFISLLVLLLAACKTDPAAERGGRLFNPAGKDASAFPPC